MRIVDRYRNGRIVLAGDAAHLNSPSGGMGMNGGIHDAHELVATLADIANGGSLDLLDRYVRRRRPIAEQEILVQAARTRARMQERAPARRPAMLRQLQRNAGDRNKAPEHFLRTEMIPGDRKDVE